MIKLLYIPTGEFLKFYSLTNDTQIPDTINLTEAVSFHTLELALSHLTSGSYILPLKSIII